MRKNNKFYARLKRGAPTICTVLGIENIFGIYTKKDDAEAAKDLTIKELYEKEIARGWMSIVDDVSDIEVEILEIEANKIANIELGGYCE